MKSAAVLVAAGSGQRFGGLKQFAPLLGRSILEWSAAAFCNKVDDLVIVCQSNHLDSLTEAVLGWPQSVTHVRCVAGGVTRQASVLCGLEALEDSAPDLVLIHDAARPGLEASTIDMLLSQIQETGSGCCAGLPVQDALHRAAGKQQKLVESINRDQVWRAQTPQGFLYQQLLAAHQAKKGQDYADDCSLARACGLDVAFCLGTEDNLKVTTLEDLTYLERSFLSRYSDIRTATGFDVHAFAETPPQILSKTLPHGVAAENKDFASGAAIKLCGIDVQADAPLVAHSDGDVGLHALTDALLGTIGLGDIGTLFPPSDMRWKDANSAEFLDVARIKILEAGGMIAHVDLTLICERPKIGPHREKMQQSIAALLKLSPSRVSVKATTTERLGFTGRSEGIAALASATVRLKADSHSADIHSK